jgi:hypothetical protein
MQLLVEYTPVKMRPYVYASEESGEFPVLKRLQEVIRREGNPTKY